MGVQFMVFGAAGLVSFLLYAGLLTTRMQGNIIALIGVIVFFGLVIWSGQTLRTYAAHLDKD
jgi:FtsH-binding integral membrane protein